MVYKSPAILADIASAYLVYRYLLVNKVKPRLSLLITSLFLFNPAFIGNSTFWGQVESFFLVFVILSLYLFKISKSSLSIAALSLAQTIKPVAILVLPFLLLRQYQQDKKISNIVRLLLTFLLVQILIYLPFTAINSVISLIVSRQLFTVGFWPYTTLNAFNFWSVLSIIRFGTIEKISDATLFFGLNFNLWGKVMFIFSALYLLLKFSRSKTSDLVFYVSLIYLSVFHFLTRLHERHSYYGLALMLLNWKKLNKVGKIALILGTAIYSFNLYYSYTMSTPNRLFLDSGTIFTVSLINFLVYLCLLITL